MEVLRFVGDLVVPQKTNFKMPGEFSNSLVFNLEGPLTRRGEPASGKICLRQDPEAFSAAINQIRPRAACLANNHIMDYGVAGFEDTLIELKRLDIPFYGAGTLEDRCNNPLLLRFGDGRLALLGYVCQSTHPVFAIDDKPGVAPPDPDRIAEDIELARSGGADTIVVTIHWGAEEVGYPKMTDIRLARTLSKMGVDLVVGHHAHCRQPWAQLGNTRTFFFGLGNAYFPDFSYHVAPGVEAWGKQRSWNRTSHLVELHAEGKQISTYTLRQGEDSWSVEAGDDLRRIELLDAVLPDTVHQARFDRARRFGMARSAVSRFMARPRIPSIASLRYLVRNL